MRQDEHVAVGDKSAAVATVVAAVDQARSRGPSEAAVSQEQVDHPSLMTSLPTCHSIHLLFPSTTSALLLVTVTSSCVTTYRCGCFYCPLEVDTFHKLSTAKTGPSFTEQHFLLLHILSSLMNFSASTVVKKS